MIWTIVVVIVYRELMPFVIAPFGFDDRGKAVSYFHRLSMIGVILWMFLFTLLVLFI